MAKKTKKNQESLNWKAICKKYPDEFVVLGNPEYDEKGQIASGILFDHNKDYQKIKLQGGNFERITLRWTGKKPKNFKFPDISSTR
jgi:hypothetical protein